MKFNGTAEDLETVVTALGRKIVSSADKGNMHQIKTEEKETLNLFPNGTLQIQGNPGIKAKFEEDFAQYNGHPTSTPQPVTQVQQESPVVVPLQQKQVFIVHGHDDVAREQLELVLHSKRP